MFTLVYQGDLAPIVSRIEDAFLADDFALGVVVFAMAVQDYPWTSTKKGALGADVVDHFQCVAAEKTWCKGSVDARNVNRLDTGCWDHLGSKQKHIICTVSKFWALVYNIMTLCCREAMRVMYRKTHAAAIPFVDFVSDGAFFMVPGHARLF